MDLLVTAASSILKSQQHINQVDADAIDSTEEDEALYSNPRYKTRVTYDDFGFTDQSDLRVNKVQKILSQRDIRRFVYREFFSSVIDAEYFADNEFITCLRLLGFDNLYKLSRLEWSFVRGIMGVEIGRPRRFSYEFLKSEREKLRMYRTYRRRRLSVPPVGVGDTVTVVDIKSLTFAHGLVISTLETIPDRIGNTKKRKLNDMIDEEDTEVFASYLVQMERPEMGVAVYADVDIGHQFNLDLVMNRQMGSISSIGTSVDVEVEVNDNESDMRQQGDSAEVVSINPLNSNRSNNSNSNAHTTDESSDESASSSPSTQILHGHKGDREMGLESDPLSQSQSLRLSQSSSCSMSYTSIGTELKPDHSMENSSSSKESEVTQQWMDCQHQANRTLDEVLEDSLSSLQSSTGTTASVTGSLNTSDKEIINRCIASLIFIRDMKDSWLPQDTKTELLTLGNSLIEADISKILSRAGFECICNILDKLPRHILDQQFT